MRRFLNQAVVNERAPLYPGSLSSIAEQLGAMCRPCGQPAFKRLVFWELERLIKGTERPKSKVQRTYLNYISDTIEAIDKKHICVII